MSTAADPPIVRKGQLWLYEGQDWKIHDVTEGQVVLIGPYRRHNLHCITLEELFAGGELQSEAQPPSRKAQKIAAAFEATQRRIASGRGKPGPKPKKPLPPRPWRCSVLAVDTAANSGWSVWVDGKLRDYGEAKTSHDAELRAICTMSLEYPPTVLVLEHPAGFVYRGRSASVLIGLGAAAEAWRRAWRDAGGAKVRIVQVLQRVWRAQLFGKSSRMREYERQYAQIALKREGYPVPDDLGADEMAALCIGSWALYAWDVAETLPEVERNMVGEWTMRGPPEPPRWPASKAANR